MSDVFDSVMRGLKEAEQHLAGTQAGVVHIPAEIDVASVRGKAELSQEAFASLIGVSKRTLENWEQGRRVPQGPARVLLAMVARDPQIVQKLLAA